MMLFQRFSTLLLIILLFANCSPEQKKLDYNTQLDPQKTYDLILLLGQSNMVGMGSVSELTTTKLPQNITYLNQGIWTDKNTMPDRFGPEVTLAKLLHFQYPEKEFILYKYAVGGSSLYNWSPSFSAEKATITEHPELGALYDSMLLDLTTQLKGISHTPKALFWMQGETDAFYAQSAHDYEQNLSTFISAIRMALKTPDLPIFIGQVNPPKSLYAYTSEVRAVQLNVVKFDSNTFLIETDELEKWDDSLHYSTKGQQELGTLMATQYINYYTR